MQLTILAKKLRGSYIFTNGLDIASLEIELPLEEDTLKMQLFRLIRTLVGEDELLTKTRKSPLSFLTRYISYGFVATNASKSRRIIPSIYNVCANILQ